MNLTVDCPHCRAPLRISDDLLGTQTKCKACQREFIIPGSTCPLLPSRSKKFGIIEQRPYPFFRILPWLRRPIQYPLRATLLALVLLDIFFLLTNASTQDSPSIFIAFAAAGFIVAMFSFLDDRSKLCRVFSMSTTAIVCCITLIFAFIPTVFLLILSSIIFGDMTLFGNKIEFRDWLSLAWGPTEVLLILFSVFAVLAFLFIRYGFFRPAAVCFLLLSLIPAAVRDICCEPTKLYDYMPITKHEINMAKHETFSCLSWLSFFFHT